MSASMSALIATDAKPLSVHISKMSGKLSGIDAINTNTITNEFCYKMYHSGNENIICTNCYSMDMLTGSRKNCQPAFQRNSDMLSGRLLEPSEIPYINSAIFRFDGHGELIDDYHFANLCAIATANPQCTFSLWTKRKDIVWQYMQNFLIPKNMILIYSNPRTDKLITEPPRGFDKVFNNVPKDWTGHANCTGQKCIECRLCYERNDTDVIIEHTKKRS